MPWLSTESSAVASATVRIYTRELPDGEIVQLSEIYSDACKSIWQCGWWPTTFYFSSVHMQQAYILYAVQQCSVEVYKTL